MDKEPVKTEDDTCEECGGTGEVTFYESVYPHEPHIALVGMRKCSCQIIEEDYE